MLEISVGIICYFVTVSVFYFMSKELSYQISGRLPLYRELDKKWYGLASFLTLLRQDLIDINCPWSWRRAVYYRVNLAHAVLQKMRHKNGWRPEDCHDPSKHDQIARECFISRKIFWRHQAIHFFFSPIFFFLQIYLLLELNGM